MFKVEQRETYILGVSKLKETKPVKRLGIEGGSREEEGHILGI